MGLFGNKQKKRAEVNSERKAKKDYTEIKVVQGKMAEAKEPAVTEMQEIKQTVPSEETVTATEFTAVNEVTTETEAVREAENALSEGAEENSATVSIAVEKSALDTTPLPELDIPDTVFEKVPNELLQENRDYIAILLKELEEAKQENEQLRIPRQEKNPWKVFAVILSLVIVAGVVWFLWFYTYVYQGATDALQEKPTPTATPTVTQGAQIPEDVNTYIIKDLETYVAQLPKDATGDFRASVEKRFGCEYLCLSTGGVAVYYRNEFIPGTEDEQRILLDNGSALIEFDWEYDLTGDIRSLVPAYGNFAQDETVQFAFVQYAEEYTNFPEKIRFVDVTNLYDCGEVDVETVLSTIFSTTYSEQPAEDSTDTEKLMQLTINGVSYLYRIPNESYVNAMLYEENVLRTDKYFELQFTEAGVVFQTVLTLEDGSCLGELKGSMKREGLRFTFGSFVYGAYVQADQEDAGSDGIIDPIPRPWEDYVLMSGKNRERFLIPISDEIPALSLDFEHWTKVEDTEDIIGRYEYVQDGEVVSICGIDVSKYQGEIDWEKVKAAGVEYAIIRLGYRGMNEGTLELDPYYFTNIKKANEAGVKVGIYFFSQAKNTDEAEKEAEFVLENIKNYDVTYPVVFDTEEVTTYAARANGLTRAERTDCCIAFCEKIKEAGYTPMIYANTRYMIMGLELERLNAYDKWFAYYGTNYTFPYEFTMFQYSDTGRIPGIDGDVDLDVSFVDYAAQNIEE